MVKGLKKENILPHEYIKLFKERCEKYIAMCDIALSCDKDSEYANAFILDIMNEHNFVPGQ